MKRQAVILCPGRGSYTAASLGYLSRDAPDAARATLDTAVDRSDGLRTARGDLTIRSMDGARKFQPSFLQGENVAGLTFACTAFDALRLDRSELQPVAVSGNSMGWYSALFAAGVFGLDDTFDLIESMGGMTRDGAIGGQLIYPIVDDDWHHDAERESAVEEALHTARSAGSEAGHSIHYGGFAVLWADESGLERLDAELPAIKLGANEYPLTLPGHSAFHSPLMVSISQRAVDQAFEPAVESTGGPAHRRPRGPLASLDHRSRCAALVHIRRPGYGNVRFQRCCAGGAARVCPRLPGTAGPGRRAGIGRRPGIDR